MLDEIQDKTIMKIYLGRKYLGRAQLNYTSTFTREVSAHKLGMFNQNTEAVVVRMEILEREKFPREFEFDNLSVRLEHNTWRNAIKDRNPFY